MIFLDVSCVRNLNMIGKLNLLQRRFSIELNLEFTITLVDILIPENCPILNIPFEYGNHAFTYSIDRLDSNKGYIKGNVVIISNKANMMKSNATFEEIEMLYFWLKSIKEKQI